MRAEFYRHDAPDQVIGGALWDGTRVQIHADDPAVRSTLERIFRLSSIALVDASTRPTGARGDTVVEPGDLQWFMSAAGVRGAEAGLGVRLVAVTPGGWDPAGAYVPMGVWISRRQGRGAKQETLGTPSQ